MRLRDILHTLAILICVTALSSAQFIINPYSFAAPGGGGGGTTIYGPVDMEATGAESGWSTFAGSPNWDQTTPHKNGAQSLDLPIGATVQSSALNNGTITWKFWLYSDDLPGADDAVMNAYNTGFSEAMVAQITSTGQLKFVASAVATTTDGMAADTWYFVTVVFAKGTGSDGVASVGFSTDGSSPTSGNKYAAVSTHNVTTNMVNNYFLGGTCRRLFDDIATTTP